MAKAGARRPRGTIRQRGKSLQVTVDAGIDPLTGRRMFLIESPTEPRPNASAGSSWPRLMTSVPRTRATFGRALEAWLRTHEAEASTIDGYRGYVRRTIQLAAGRRLDGRMWGEFPRPLVEAGAAGG